MKQGKKNKGDNAAFLASVLFFYKIHPYFVWPLVGHYMEAIVALIIGLLFFINRNKMVVIEKVLFLLLCLIVVLYPITSKQNFNVFVSVAPIVFIPFATKSFNDKVYDSFLSIYCIILIPSLIVWVMYCLGVISPYKILPPLNELKLDNYQIFPLLAVEGHSIRFQGPFDEPGVIGTISAMMLCINNINIKDYRNIILLISGICSISLFFYVIIGLYLALSRLRSIKQILIMLPFLLVAIIVIYKTPVLKEMIVDRLEWDSDTGTIAGDNRTALFTIETLERVKGTRELWLGVNDKIEYVERTAYSSSFLNVILFNGLLYFLLVLSFYIIYGWCHKNDILSFILYVIVFFAVIFQRPSFNNPYYVFLWICLARQKEILFN